MMMGFGVVGFLLMLLFWGALIAGAVVLVRALFPQGGTTPTSRSQDGTNARQILDQRYARGEISREEYEIMKGDIDS
jgi:putative membrane protein